MEPQFVILAAGMGTRLGRPFPKPLTPLKDGRTIMAQQLDNVHAAFGQDASVMVVIGFKPEQVMGAAADSASFVFNPEYEHTNTSKSLVRALRLSGTRGVLWMNGDVVFHPEVLTRVKALIEEDKSFVCVDTAATADEEVKYTVDADGFIEALSKTVTDALGEAVGINYISSTDKSAFAKRLHEVGDQDYFERGLELSIEQDGLQLTPVDISDLFAVEVDFDEDLDHANTFI